MARSRYIKPDFFEDTTISELSIGARLLYIALWQLMDRGGICPDDVKLIKGHAFRYDEKITLKNASEFIEELISSRRIRRISFEGKSYLYCAALENHQHFHKDEKVKYVIPQDILEAPLQHGANPVLAPLEPHTSRHNRGEQIEDNGERITQNPTSVGARSHWLAELWNQHAGNLPKVRDVTSHRKKLIAQRLRDNPHPNYWQEVILKLGKSDFANGKNANGWRATFEFLLQPDTHVKTLEGKYDNQGAAPVEEPQWKREAREREAKRAV